MELHSERLVFREIEVDDLDVIHQLHSDWEVDRYGTLGVSKSVDETRKRMINMIDSQSEEPRKNYSWKITLKNSDYFIGLAGIILSLDRFNLGEIYYELLPDFWGKGFGTEVAKKLISSGFDCFNLHRIEAGVATDNVKSIYVLEKCGMLREGLRPNILPIRGEWKDSFHYAMVEDDFRNY